MRVVRSALRIEHVPHLVGRLERLALHASDLAWLGSSAALELKVFADGVVQQSHAPPHHTAPAPDPFETTLAGPEQRPSIGARGAIAQLGERLDRTQEVGGSSPPSSIATEALLMPGFWRL